MLTLAVVHWDHGKNDKRDPFPCIGVCRQYPFSKHQTTHRQTSELCFSYLKPLVNAWQSNAKLIMKA